MNLTIISILISGVLAFGSAWKIQGWRFDAQEKARLEQVMIDQQVAFRSYEHEQNKVIEAQNNSAKRIISIRNDANSAKSQLNSLRDATNSALFTSSESLTTSINAATTLGKLLGECSARYQILGEKADGHVSDIKTLIESNSL